MTVFDLEPEFCDNFKDQVTNDFMHSKTYIPEPKQDYNREIDIEQHSKVAQGENAEIFLEQKQIHMNQLLKQKEYEHYEKMNRNFITESDEGFEIASDLEIRSDSVDESVKNVFWEEFEGGHQRLQST